MSLMEQFSNPDLIVNLSFGDKMLASLITMFMGLGITFTVLILIWIFIAIMGKCLNTTGGNKAAKAVEAAATAAPAPAAAVTKAAADETSDETLVAVIAAAIAAYQGANASNLVVRKIVRLSGEQTPWGASALEDRLDTRKF